MRGVRPPTAVFLQELFLRASKTLMKYGVTLGPRCLPCTHNTLTLSDKSGRYHAHGIPRLV